MSKFPLGESHSGPKDADQPVNVNPSRISSMVQGQAILEAKGELSVNKEVDAHIESQVGQASFEQLLKGLGQVEKLKDFSISMSGSCRDEGSSGARQQRHLVLYYPVF